MSYTLPGGEPMPSGIYVWKLSGIPKYVGKSMDVHQRMSRNHHENKALHHAVTKYGLDAFEKEVVCYCEIDELNEKEEYYIRNLHTHRSENGYNLTWGGDGVGAGEDHPLYGVTGEAHPSWGRKHSQETLEKLSESHKGIRHSEEARQKIAAAKTGKNNPFFGHKYENATSGYFGVSKSGNKYRALITVNKKLIHIGYYETESEAGQAYNDYVIEHKLPNPLNII
jgi:group I intron endonuclease